MANVDLYEIPLAHQYAEAIETVGTSLDLPLVNDMFAPAVTTYYQMEADDSVTGAEYSWMAAGAADWAGAGYPGPNAPVNIRVSGSR